MKQEALIGRTIAGKYEVEILVGQGAMGCVYRARQLALGTTLALKVLHRQLAGDPMFAARFLREAQAASRVDHPSSMRVVDFGEEPDGLLYIAMEYVDGKTLARIIEQDSPLPVARIIDIASQALAALAVAHDLGVIHRDLKPENIMIIEGQDDEGCTHDIVKVCDFGVAKLLEGGARGPSVTAKGVAVGTPEYMSPEQARGDSLDASSDIYAMGVLLFHLMTGKVPFDASTAFGTALMHVNDEPTRPRLLNPRVDSRLEKICLKAMRKRPCDRHASARELRAELRALIGHEDEEDGLNDPNARRSRGGDAVPASLLAQVEARPRRSGVLLAAAVCAVTVAAGEYLYHRPGPQAAAPHEPVQTASITLPVSPRATPAPEPATAAESAPEAAGTAEKNARVPRAHVGSKVNARRTKGHGGVSAPIAIGEESAPAPDATGKTKGKGEADSDADTKPDTDAKAIAKPDSTRADLNLPTAKPDPKLSTAKPDPKPPAKPPAVRSDAAKPAAAKPEAAKPEAAKPEAAKPEAAKPEAAKPEAAKPEAPKPEAPKPGAARAEGAKPDSKPAASKAADGKKPAGIKPDPADAPLPVFPVPSTEAPPAKVPQLPPAQP